MTTYGSSSRLQSLDAFRGATIAAMILVNNPGSWSAVYTQLEHSRWNGWTFTDWIFPFFLWIVGVAMTLSFAKRKERGDDAGKLLVHVFTRSLTIFAIGLFLNGFPFVMFMAGWALVCFSMFYWLMDVKGKTAWARPFVIYGMNAIAIYAITDIVAVLLDVIRVSGPDGAPVTLKGAISSWLFVPHCTPERASVLFAAAFVLAMYVVVWILWRRKVFIRV
jgi:predicted acyltransferase